VRVLNALPDEDRYAPVTAFEIAANDRIAGTPWKSKFPLNGF
jgi:hypothetical protein